MWNRTQDILPHNLTPISSLQRFVSPHVVSPTLDTRYLEKGQDKAERVDIQMQNDFGKRYGNEHSKEQVVTATVP